MPTPNKDEKRNDFVARCVPMLMKEGKKQKQAVGACEGIYNSHKRGGIAKALKGGKE